MSRAIFGITCTGVMILAVGIIWWTWKKARRQNLIIRESELSQDETETTIGIGA